LIPVLLGLPARDAAAQFEVIGPGSTVHGDMWRGAGAAAYGWGLYNHHTAIGQAINLDTWLRLDSSIAQARWAQAHYRYLRFERSKESINRALETNQRRYRESPTEADVLTGNPLNRLVQELTGPEFGFSALRLATVPVAAGLLEQLPLHLGRAGVAIAPGRLKVDRQWPMPLQDPTFATRRQAYDQAVAAALEQAARGRLSAEAVAAVDRTIRDLRDGLEKDAQMASVSDRTATRAFLDRLTRSAQMFHDADALAALAAVLNTPGTTVAALLETMGQHRLQFGVAETPTERALYRELYASLVRQRSLLVARRDPLPPGLPAPGPNSGLASIGPLDASDAAGLRLR
jgi:hypothetical protein